MIPRQFEQITLSDLEALIASLRSEGGDLEFKSTSVGPSEEHRREFLADVSSLANANGGDLIFGLAESEGFAADLSLLSLANADAEILRLEAMIRDGLAPRLAVRTKWISTLDDRTRGAIVMRIPASLASPHRIVFRNSGRFFTRDSRGKHEMNLDELRDAFRTAELLPSVLRSHHDKLLVDVQSGFPMTMLGGPIAALTVLPVGLHRERHHFDIDYNSAVLTDGAGRDLHFVQTLEGLLNYNPLGSGIIQSYSLTHRAGYSDTAFVCGGTDQRGRETIDTESLEKSILRLTSRTISVFATLGVAGPWAVFLSFKRVLGYSLYFDVRRGGSSTRMSLRPEFSIPELIIEEANDESLEPLLRSIWFAFGEERTKDFRFGK